MIDDDDVGPPRAYLTKHYAQGKKWLFLAHACKIITGKQFCLSQHSLQNTLRKSKLKGEMTNSGSSTSSYIRLCKCKKKAMQGNNRPKNFLFLSESFHHELLAEVFYIKIYYQ